MWFVPKIAKNISNKNPQLTDLICPVTLWLIELHSPVFLLGLQTVTRASIDESVSASTRVHFNYLVTRKVLYYHPRNETCV